MNFIKILNKDYIGCYTDNYPRDLSSSPLVSLSLTIEICIANCRSNGYRYAGLQAGYN